MLFSRSLRLFFTSTRFVFLIVDFNSYLDPLEDIMQTLAQEHEDILSHKRREEEGTDGDEADLPIRVPAGAPRIGVARSISKCFLLLSDHSVFLFFFCIDVHRLQRFDSGSFEGQ